MGPFPKIVISIEGSKEIDLQKQKMQQKTSFKNYYCFLTDLSPVNLYTFVSATAIIAGFCLTADLLRLINWPIF